MARWVEYFESVLNTVSTISEEAIREIPQRPIIEKLDKPPSLKEIVSSRKSPGSDGIPPEIHNHGGASATSHLHSLFVSIWQQGKVPQAFREALIVHLYNIKGDRRICDNHCSCQFSGFSSCLNALGIARQFRLPAYSIHSLFGRRRVQTIAVRLTAIT